MTFTEQWPTDQYGDSCEPISQREVNARMGRFRAELASVVGTRSGQPLINGNMR